MWIERFVRTRDTLSPHLAHRPLQLSVRLLHARWDMRFIEVMPLGSIAGFQMDSVVPVSEMKLRIESELGHLEPVDWDGHIPDNTLGAFGRKQLAAGQSHTCLLNTNRGVVCWGVDSSGVSLLTGNGVGAFAQVVTGLDSCATKGVARSPTRQVLLAPQSRIRTKCAERCQAGGSCKWYVARAPSLTATLRPGYGCIKHLGSRQLFSGRGSCR